MRDGDAGLEKLSEREIEGGVRNFFEKEK